MMAGSISLGKDSLYPEHYAPDLLEPIARRASRDAWHSPESALPFTGEDIWTAYELSWLDPKGKPIVAVAEFRFPSESTHIVESKSFKYYLNSLNQTHYASEIEVQATLEQDLSQCADTKVSVVILPVADSRMAAVREPSPILGECVDGLELTVRDYQPSASLLTLGSECVTNHRLHSHLLKSNCPVTGQPDWATVWIEYSGQQIEPAAFFVLCGIVSPPSGIP